MVNLRDLGGIKTICGKTVKRGRLYRSAELVGLNEDDLAFLKDNGIKQVIDFRTKSEISERPNDNIANINFKHIDIMGEKIDPNQINNWFENLSIESVRETMQKIYKDFVTSNGYKEFLDDITKDITIFHCAAGKDRTGFAAALVLKILGVSDEDILTDYLKTNEGRKEANKQIESKYREKGLSEDQLKALSLAYSAEESFLQSSFDAIQEKYGDFDNFLKIEMQVTSEYIYNLKNLMLE